MSIETLKNKILLIKQETEEGANSAERVGDCLETIVDELEDKKADKSETRVIVSQLSQMGTKLIGVDDKTVKNLSYNAGSQEVLLTTSNNEIKRAYIPDVTEDRSGLYPKEEFKRLRHNLRELAKATGVENCFFVSRHFADFSYLSRYPLSDERITKDVQKDIHNLEVILAPSHDLKDFNATKILRYYVMYDNTIYHKWDAFGKVKRSEELNMNWSFQGIQTAVCNMDKSQFIMVVDRNGYLRLGRMLGYSTNWLGIFHSGGVIS